MDSETFSKYERAGHIASRARSEALPFIQPGKRILDIAGFIEKRITELGAKPAFPVNVSINDITAHYTPLHNDAVLIESGDIVKFDIGVHVDGYVADMAFSYCSERNELIDAAGEVLGTGMKSVRPGAKISEVSLAISDKVRELGLGVIVNLTGHYLDKYVLHGSPSIPNIPNNNANTIKEGDVLALEPFIVKSSGTVKDSEPVEIYQFVQSRPARLPESRKILDMALNDFEKLPFARRWIIERGINPMKASMALRQLEETGSLKSYATLRESRGRPVAQAEHTIVVGKTNKIITL